MLRPSSRLVGRFGSVYLSSGVRTRALSRLRAVPAPRGLSGILVQPAESRLTVLAHGRPTMSICFSSKGPVGPGDKGAIESAKTGVEKEVEKGMEEAKPPMWTRIKDAAKHTWDGIRLLGREVSISVKYLRKLGAGHSLTRREQKLLTTTAADLIRFVPFAVFLAVPFMELAIPVYLRFFPNALPSTFEDRLSREERLKKQIKAKVSVAGFLQDTFEEMAKSHAREETSEELSKFFKSVREGRPVDKDTVVKFAKLFEDEFTLDSISRPQLIALTKLLGLQSFGTNTWLRVQLRTRVRSLRADDRLIRIEGLDKMSEDELRTAVRERGMSTIGLNKFGLRKALNGWIELSTNVKIPMSLLLLSRLYTYSPHESVNVDPEASISEALSSMPEDVVEDMEAILKGGENKTKLESLERMSEMIEDEAREQQEWEESAKASRSENKVDGVSKVKSDVKALQKEIEEASRELEDVQDTQKSASKSPKKPKPSVPATEAGSLEAEDDHVLQVSDILSREQLKELKECVETLSGASVLKTEREQLGSLSAEMQKLISDTKDSPYNAFGSRLVNLLDKLEVQTVSVEKEIEGSFVKLDEDGDGKVSLEELSSALALIKSAPNASEIANIVGKLDSDSDGAIDLIELKELSTLPEERVEELEEAGEGLDKALEQEESQQMEHQAKNPPGDK